MTYKELLDSLLKECERKGAEYVLAMGSDGNSSTSIYALRKEWEQAEDDLEAWLDLLRSDKVQLHDTVTEVLAEMVLPQGVCFQV